MKNFFIIFLVSLFLFPTFRAQAQNPLGQPLMKHYTYRDYRTTTAMWSAAQDRDGLLYFANNDGVVTFDGARWSLISIPNSVRGMAVDSNKRVFIGCIGDFGALQPNDFGKLTFKSYKKFLSAQDKGTYDVDRVYLSGKDDVLFLSETESGARLIRVKGEKSLKVFGLKGVFGSGQAFGTVYVNESERGLLKFENDKLVPVSGGNTFTDKEIVSIKEMPNGSALIATYDAGLYIRTSSGAIQAFPTGADDFLRGKTCYDVAVLPGGNIVVCSKDNGAVLLNASGGVIRYFTLSSGLPSENMFFSYADKEGGVWLAHAKGLTHILTEIPVTTLENIEGLAGKINSLTVHNGRLYVATLSGVFYLDLNGGTAFNAVGGITGEARSLTVAGTSLLVATGTGAYEINGVTASAILPEQSVSQLFFSPKNPNVVLASLKKGLGILTSSGGTWTYSGNAGRITELINSAEVDADGSYWLGTSYQGLLQVKNLTSGNPTIKKYGANDGLSDGYTFVQSLAGEMVFETADGVYTRSGEKFNLNANYTRLFGGKSNKFTVSETGKIWFFGTDNITVGEKTADGKFNIDSTTYANLPNEKADVIYAGKEHTFIAFNDKIISINNQGATAGHPFVALIRKVTAGEDSVIYDGFYWDEERNFSRQQTDFFRPALSYSLNSVTIDVGSTSYLNSAANEYQFMLDGQDKDWSGWQKRSSVTYSNLSEGGYTLKVRVKNALGQVSSVAEYSFEVKPPFYRHPLAYLIYLIGGVGLIYGAIRLNSRRLEAKNRELEAVVTERTKEVNEQKGVLEVQNKQLGEQKVAIEKAFEDLKNTQDQLVESEKMAALGQLIANIAHEINTPIGAINGASTNINKTLPTTLSALPGFFKKLTPELEELFFKLVDKSLGFTGALSSREERQYTKDVKAFLDEKGLTAAGNSAKDLVKIGIFDGLDEFIPLFNQPNVSEIIDMASAIGKIRVNLDNIGLAVQKTQKITYALKTYAHKQVGEEKVPTNVVSTVDTVLTLYSNQLKSGVAVTTNFDRNLPDIQGFPDELHQVWTNIIHNALQAMDNKGSLDINVGRDNGNIKVTITDSGPGIPDHVLPKIFDPFFTTKAAGEGSGLGLDICSKIIRKHDGKIDVKTRPGETTFIVTFPTQPSAS